MKTCSRCAQRKPERWFYKHAEGAGGLNPRCKNCVIEVCGQYAKRNRVRCNAAQKRWRERNPEKSRLKSRNFAKAHPDKVRAWGKKWRDNNPEKTWAKALRRFGITIQEYKNILLAQHGVCAICQRSCKSGKRLAVDHCHLTNVIRGLLCQDCNTSMGKFKDSSVLLRRAAEYIEKHKT